MVLFYTITKYRKYETAARVNDIASNRAGTFLLKQKSLIMYTRKDAVNKR